MERGMVMARRTRKAQSRYKKLIIFGLEIILLLALAVLAYFVFAATDEDTGIQRVELDDDDLSVNEQVEENEALDQYTTIALFGVDSTVGELTKNTRSDTIMIASINNETNEVKIMSVYRDTYLNLGDDTYNKCNAAYAKGGPQAAISMLNMNLDLDITDFVTIGFDGLMDVVDAVGGIEIEIDSAELKHINNYQISIADTSDLDGYDPVTTTGLQTVDGLQAVSYCRIRYTAGDDFARTERQREVIQAILDEAQSLSVGELTGIAENAFSSIYTSLELTDIIAVLSNIAAYEIVDEGGFPGEEYLTTATLGSVGSSVIPVDLEDAVTEFHERFFGSEAYEVSDEVKDISDKIKSETQSYIE